MKHDPQVNGIRRVGLVVFFSASVIPQAAIAKARAPEHAQSSHKQVAPAQPSTGASGASAPNAALHSDKPADLAADQSNGEIVITARKRAERAIDVPASLNVFSGESLQQTGVTSLEDVQYRSPGLKVAIGGGSTRISLRGVGTNIASGSPSVAVHMDGIYIPNTAFALTELFDLDRIEVLKGPEGTLYGRNATGGVINLISQAPSNHVEADGWIGYGSFNLVTAEAGVTLPFNDRGGVRVSAAYANDDGYTKNLNPAGGEIDSRGYKGGRARGHYELSTALTADFTVQYSNDTGTLGLGNSNNPDSPVFASIPPQQRTDPRHINVDTPPRSNRDGLLLSGTLTADLGAVTLKSLTGYIDYNSKSRVDVDGSGGFIAFSDTTFHSKFFSQEFQALGHGPGGTTWTAGAYYARERNSTRSIETDADYPDPTGFVFTDVQQHLGNRSYAVFGELTVPISRRLSALVGGRYTDEKQFGHGLFAAPLFFPEPIPTEASIKNKAFTPKFVLQYKPNADSQIYASVTRGFKSGGVSLGLTGDTFQPEKIWAYEIGSKNRFADGRVELSGAAFYYDYTNLQLRTVLFTDTGPQVTITNAAKAAIKGVEVATVLHPVPRLTIDFNGAYIDSQLKKFISPVTFTELNSLPMPLTPKWSFTSGIQYRADLGNPGALTARAEVNYQSSVLFPQFADIQRERQPGYVLVNANLRYDLPGDRIYVALIGRNLTNKTYLTQRFFFEGFADTEFFGVPRTIEGRVGFKF